MSMGNVTQRKNMDLALDIIEDFRNGAHQKFYLDYHIHYKKYTITKKGIKWLWQSLDSITVKSPLGGDDWS